MAAVTLDSVTVRAADGTTLLHDVSFDIAQGELLVIVGPSGSGKTSLIRAVAGLERVVSGAVAFDGVNFTQIEVRERDVGIVFQTQTLFPSQRARGNVAFPLRIRAFSDKEIAKRVDAEARALGIGHILDRWPRELSAGHQQLVQIARALVRVPNVLLLDEPMAHLDPPMRQRLRRDLKELQRGYDVTTIYATNDPTEAMFMADRIVALERGRIRQVGVPSSLYAEPADTHIAWLTGPISFVDATVESDSAGYWLRADGFRIRAWPPQLGRHQGTDVRIGIRPEDVRVQAGGTIRAVIVGPTFEAGAPATKLQLGQVTIAAASLNLPVGTPLDVLIDRCLVFGADGRLICSVG